MRIIKIFILCLLFILPFGELLRFDIGNNIRIKPLDVLTGVITFSWVLSVLTNKISRPEFSWYYILFPLVCLLSLVVNSIWLKPSELAVSALYLLRWISYAGIFFVLMRIDDSFKKKLLVLLLIDGLIIVIFGFLQYFFFSDLKPLYYLGWDDHMYRMFSVFLDPNYTGGFLVLYLLFVSGIFYKTLTERKSNSLFFVSHRLSNRLTVIVLSVIAALTCIAIFLTFSRSSLLMLIVGLSTFFILIGRKKLILLLFTVILVFTLIISSKFYVENINLFRQASIHARIGNYQDALHIMAENPVLGVGFNTYRYAKEKYSIQTGWVKAPSHADAGVDNSFLFVLVTTGIAGFVGFLLLWGSLLKRAFALYKNNSDIFSIIFIASSMGLFIHAMFINSLFFPAIMLWMWILAGFMEKKLH